LTFSSKTIEYRDNPLLEKTSQAALLPAGFGGTLGRE
jgi:hypothetical protein